MDKVLLGRGGYCSNKLMHMNTKTTYLKGFGVAIVIGVLGLLSAAPARAALASVAITASPTTVCTGQPAIIAWSSTDATSISIDQGIGAVLPYGSTTVYPTQTTVYTITGTNTTGGYAVASATVFVSALCGTPTPSPVAEEYLKTNLRRMVADYLDRIASEIDQLEKPMPSGWWISNVSIAEHVRAKKS